MRGRHKNVITLDKGFMVKRGSVEGLNAKQLQTTR